MNKPGTSPSENKAWKTAMRALDTANSVQAQAAKVVATAVIDITTSPPIGANAAVSFANPVPGVEVGDAVIVNPPAGGIQGVAVSGMVDSPGSVTIVLSNVQTVPITLTDAEFNVMVLRKGTT
jgi:hypothetical protein